MPKAERHSDDDHFIEKYDREQRAKAATERAIARAVRPRDERNEEVRYKYAQQALERESALVASTLTGSRNDQLNISAMKLGQLVATGYLEEHEVISALESASLANGLTQEDGIKQTRKTIASGLSKGISEPRNLDEVGLGMVSEYEAVPVKLRIKSAYLADIEKDFWVRRASLTNIYNAALYGLLSPWALLGCCAAKVLTMCPPSVTLPPLVGISPGSLNWFCIIAGESGFGKTVTKEATDSLIKSTVQQRNVGSGEGMIEAYRRPKSDDEPGNYEAIMFWADEIDSLAAQKNRTGSTTLSTLRSAFSGATLGAATKASANFHLESHSYRMTLIVGAQPGRVGTLMDESDAGTPQRFMWFPALDDRVEEDRPLQPVELEVPTVLDSATMKYGAQLRVPDTVEREVTRSRVRVMKGFGDPLDSHKLFVREKFSYALALLDGRDYMTDEDWELSGVAMQVSDYTREWVLAASEAVEVEQATKLGKTSGIIQAEAERAKASHTDQAVNRVCDRLMEYLKNADGQGLTQGELNRKLPSRDRPLLTAALTRLQVSDMAMQLDRRWMVFDARQKGRHDDEPF